MSARCGFMIDPFPFSHPTGMEDVPGIVIVGAGVAGLATALALHRLGLKSLVLESADCLRTSGFAIGTWPNAWRALEALGVADVLRQQHIQILEMALFSFTTGKFLGEIKLKEPDQFEVRALKRNLLLEALEKELPHGTIRFGAKVVAIEDDCGEYDYKLIHLADGSTIKSKVLVGCDGVKSVVAKYLGVAAPTFTGRLAVRAVVEFPEGHGWKPGVLQCFGDGFRGGFVPIDDKVVYWFMTWSASEEGEDLEENPTKVKQLALRNLGKLDSVSGVIERTEISKLFISRLQSSWPFDLLGNKTFQGNVCLAGDALHAMTPDLAQGGCSALEDGVVLGRCLGAALLLGESGNGDERERVRKGIEAYVKERRWRCFQLVSTAYIAGRLLQSGGRVINFLRDNCFAPLMAKATFGFSKYDCGKLSVGGCSS